MFKIFCFAIALLSLVDQKRHSNLGHTDGDLRRCSFRQIGPCARLWRLARNLRQDNHRQGDVLSAFHMDLFFSGIPLKMGEQIVYLLASYLVARHSA